jgi:hypothetical protein
LDFKKLASYTPFGQERLRAAISFAKAAGPDACSWKKVVIDENVIKSYELKELDHY